MQFLLILISWLLLVTPKAYAVLPYANGVYTNICGTGTDASRNMCNQGCNTTTGSCSANGNKVVKFVCDGRQTECRSNESAFSSSQSVAGIGCGKTVQIDVFTKTCRVNGGWTCGTNDMVDYFVWYSGDCPVATIAPTSIPTPTPMILKSSCDDLTILSGDGSFVPSNVKMKVRGSDSKAPISQFRFYFGDGQTTEGTDAEVTHRYESSGTFSVRADIRDSSGNWKTSDACMKTVTIKPIPIIESHKSQCANVFITEGNQTLPPTTAKFSITGYDNKGAIKKYRIEYGDGTQEEKETPNFEKRYEKAGTYEIKGYVLDTENNWKGGTYGCVVPLYIQTQPMETQPKTGTPTLFTILGISSGVLGLFLVSFRKRLGGYLK